jgi:hypothetical protein
MNASYFITTAIKSPPEAVKWMADQSIRAMNIWDSYEFR